MKLTRRNFLGLVGAFGLGGCAGRRRLGLGGSPGRLTFAAINDVHVLDTRSTTIVNRAVKGINANPDVAFTVVLGDVATDGKLEELRLARMCFDGLERPWFAVPGNHDVFTRAENIYANYMNAFDGMNWLEQDEGWLFMGFNSCEGDGSDVTVSREQMNWIAKRLKKIRQGRPIALFAHHPFNPTSKAYRVINAEEVLGLFSGHNLKLVATGHYHGNQIEGRDSVLFTTTACCSTTRPNFDGTEEKGYRLFHLDGEDIDTEFVEVSVVGT